MMQSLSVSLAARKLGVIGIPLLRHCRIVIKNQKLIF